ncbi:hypothetical protein NE237_019874 [Protea cynaroides]|uniref:Core Histone H2A/H2B/H3 domain-containing protein n=1 Tax=Protea cynaroides TaxID=273540 RepID=A0A9Q0HA35_9MAGN|nr:hypothetical protein NE237_019874 [Protea cynaroides]
MILRIISLARIKKIMKADEDVRMISAEAPIIFAKACEFFKLELTIRSWLHAEEIKHRTLQKNEIAAAITRTDIFDFLVDIVQRDEIKDEVALLRRPLRTPFEYRSSLSQISSSSTVIWNPNPLLRPLKQNQSTFFFFNLLSPSPLSLSQLSSSCLSLLAETPVVNGVAF